MFTNFVKLLYSNLVMKKLKFWILLSLALHILAAAFNVGYQYYDEYFQTIEFASAKIGLTPFSELPWEYPAQIRSWFLPSIIYLLVKISHGLGVTTAKYQMFVIQFFFSLLGWAASLVFYQTLLKQKDTIKQTIENSIWKWFCLFWFLPYFHVRTSGENVGTSLWLLGFSLFIQEGSIGLTFLSGLLLGLSFLTRFQMGVMIAGLFAWRLFVGVKNSADKGVTDTVTRTNRKGRRGQTYSTLIAAGLGLLAAYGLGMCLDYWGYGVWTHSAWNYFKINLLEHRANDFGTSPWWEYFSLLWDQVPLGLGLYFPVLFALGWLYNPLSPLTWIGIPFSLIHCGIAHKELRFVYPLVPFLPVYLSEFLTLHPQIIRGVKLFFQKLLNFFSTLIRRYWILGCCLLLPTAVFRAERNPFIWYGYISTHYPQSLSLVGWSIDPFRDVFPVYFYRPRYYKFHKIETSEALQTWIEEKDTYVFRPDTQIPLPYQDLLSKCQLVYQVFPEYFKKLNINHWLDRAANWGLYFCPKSQRK